MTRRRDFLKATGLIAFAASTNTLCAAYNPSAQSQDTAIKPNIIFILADDLGKEWVSCYGAEDIHTPNIDRLAETGMQFENFYVMPQCTPTRLSLLTGQYPFRHGWVNHWDVPRWGGGCHYDWNRNPCMAKVMKDAGYETAVAGKWQITDFRVQPDAMEQMGFDDYCMWAGFEADNPPSDKRYWDPYIHTRQGSRTYEGAFGPDVFADFLLNFIAKKKDKPFFIYYPMVLPHTPFTTTPDEPDAGNNLAKHKAMVRYIDKITGQILSQLEKQGLRERTLVIWTTDNGTVGTITGGYRNRRVKGAKQATSEPGACVPFIVSCPGLVAQNVKTEALSDITDMLPTFADLAGGQLQKGYEYDGTSIAPFLLGHSKDTPRSWILSMGGGNFARLTDKGVENKFVFAHRVIRDKRYKLYVNTRRRPEKLVDLLNDPEESENLLNSTLPEVQAAQQRLVNVLNDLPKQDNDPIYTPLPPQSWDVPVTAKSRVWKT